MSGSRETLRVRVDVRASARLRDLWVGSQGAMAQDLPLEALQRLLVHVGADLRVVVGDAVEERGRDLPDALLALPLMGTHHPSVAHPRTIERASASLAIVAGDVLGANADTKD